jgi:hypothetical protein
MLTIRAEQMGAMGQAAVKNFEDQVIEDLKKSVPKHCRLLGEENLRKKVHAGFERARSYGLSSENGLRLFVELTFLLGSGFDKDPQLPWAAEILNASAADQAARVERLHQRSMDYLEKVSGPNNQYVNQVLARVRTEPLEGFSQGSLGGFEDYMVRRFGLLYPEKCLYVGEDALRGLIRSGLGSAKNHGLVTQRGVTLYLGLMFILGSGFDEDLQYTFASEVLSDKSVTDPATKANRLYAGALAYLDRWAA